MSFVRRVCCLTVGSSDSSGGAGIQGDLKAFASLGAYGASVVVGITAQNTQGIRERHSVPAGVVAAQMDAVLEDFTFDAVKVGTAWSAEVVEVIAGRLSALDVPIVIDPVLGTASGASLTAEGKGAEAVREHFLPLATVITPNLREAQALAGMPGEQDPRVLADVLARLGARAVVITDAVPAGGDWLFDGQRHRLIPGRRHVTGCEHGAGCAHASLLAVLLASGVPLPRAARQAYLLASTAVRHGWTQMGTGVHPVDVFTAVRFTGGAAAP